VLVTGAGGLLGGRLASALAARLAVTCARHRGPAPTGLPSVDLELQSTGSIDRALDQARPDGIVHAAALADADACEREPSTAAAVNLDASAFLARRARAKGMRLVFISTDLVLRGDRPSSGESAPAQPILVYGRTKLAGEEAVLAEGGVVARVTLVVGGGFGPRRTASEAVADALRAGRRLRLFTDQYRTPVDALSVADAIARLLSGPAAGRFHLGGPERLSRHDLGLRVARVLGLDPAPIEAVSQAASPIGAVRPADVSLDSSRARDELGWTPRPLDDAIRDGRGPAAFGS
jgi:dTDP-4-dehydrorhamnose reductase